MPKNWAGNVVFSAEHLETPTSLEWLRDVVAGTARLHVLGAGHSFSRIADTTGTLVSLRDLPDVFDVDTEAGTVRVGAGMRLAELASRLHGRGLALHNMPSLPHITIAGTIATATHGSGDTNGPLASAVRSIDLVTADGSLLTLTEGDERLEGAVVSFGALGIVTAVELAVVPAFEVEQRVHEGLDWSVLFDHSAELFAQAYSVSVFTDWQDSCSAWVKRRVDDPAPDLSWAGTHEADGPRHPIPGISAEHCTPQLGEVGAWHERLPHFRPEFTPSVGAELQSEYMVPRSHASEALRALRELGPLIGPVLQTAEIRTVAPDQYWLSFAHGRPSLAFHFTWVPDTAAVRPVLARIEAALAPWSVRPHWGKLFEAGPDVLAPRYERWADFASLRDGLDPDGKFRNEAVDRLFPR
ncbi:FAD-binding protein [Umezawaea sp. Da 62-37]|uniref:FAD-binding protein n=1 Tax=Umezawaea sp. Da 62-37 TaxID=3075927 RepID=UPI0028F70815|nr:FAD-binding protein [Umezawaea sp. Da 62-37]WNV88913.1 FAD-binding protein [Umezawaea sp. Da 62-37]